MSTFVRCVGCGEPLYGHPCRWCTCERCGNDLCHSRNGDSFTYDSTPNSFDNPPDFSCPPPQPQYVPYSCELCGNDAHYGYDCPPQVPFVVSLAWEIISEIEHAFEDKQYEPEGILELFRKLHDDVQNIHEELTKYINTPSWNRPTIYCDDDNDEDYTIAITPDLPITDSLILEDEHLDTISATESDELIKSSLVELVLRHVPSIHLPGTSLIHIESHHHFFPVDTSLIHIESRKSPTAVLFDDDTGRISIRIVIYCRCHTLLNVLGRFTRIMRRTLVNTSAFASIKATGPMIGNLKKLLVQSQNLGYRVPYELVSLVKLMEVHPALLLSIADSAICISNVFRLLQYSRYANLNYQYCVRKTQQLLVPVYRKDWSGCGGKDCHNLTLLSLGNEADSDICNSRFSIFFDFINIMRGNYWGLKISWIIVRNSFKTSGVFILGTEKVLSRLS
ncbi:hypothetical protein Tco_0143931 [Tanacetum coccineum]